VSSAHIPAVLIGFVYGRRGPRSTGPRITDDSVSVGARVLWRKDFTTHHWTRLADPGGNEFMLACSADHLRGRPAMPGVGGGLPEAG
jgi:hypothetical protein